MWWRSCERQRVTHTGWQSCATSVVKASEFAWWSNRRAACDFRPTGIASLHTVVICLQSKKDRTVMLEKEMRHGLSMWLSLFMCASLTAGTRTWDGKHDTSEIALTVAYFVPADRTPLHDWRDRVDYFCKRIEQFHNREFHGQSTLTVRVHGTPVISPNTTAALRPGDADQIWLRTLAETERLIGFRDQEHKGFPILLVLSDINWRPLDDFYRLQLKDGKPVFEGINNNGIHHPGARSGGARAAYFSREGFGWGLVSADGWRVPYRGSDCVVYHEGCGHTVGLPHPEPQNGSVMSLAQYRGWLSESWLDREQKIRMAWEPAEAPADLQTRLFSSFKALPDPAVPRPGTAVRLRLTWPEECDVESVRVRYQTSLHGPWIDALQEDRHETPPETVRLAEFERETPVSYRVDARLRTGETAEIWGYFQVRSTPSHALLPAEPGPDLQTSNEAVSIGLPSVVREVNLLTEPEECWSRGAWSVNREMKATGRMAIVSPKGPGARLELPYTPSAEYRVNVVAEPLDDPNALTLGLTTGSNRFLCLFGFRQNNQYHSAIENIDGQNVGNETTIAGRLFRRGRLSQVSVTVRKTGVRMTVDGSRIVDWKGRPGQLTLDDYWKTPNAASLFIGSYNCRYRIYRVTVEELSERRPPESFAQMVHEIAQCRNSIRDLLSADAVNQSHVVIQRVTPVVRELTRAARSAGLSEPDAKLLEDAVEDLLKGLLAVDVADHREAKANWHSESGRINAAVLTLARLSAGSK